MPTEPSRNEIEFDRILAEFTNRMRENENPDIQEYVGHYPDLKNQILQLFPLVMQLEGTKRENESADANSRWKIRQIDRLGDYILLREIGRGGMGVVYEARQSSLERRVALKVLPQDQALGQKNLARFQREARMAARLHHSNIVPVLGTGHAKGTHFIVMQLINGVGLDQIVDHLIGRQASALDSESQNVPELFESEGELASGDERAGEVAAIARTSILKSGSSEVDWKKIARIGIQIAGALSHAHQQQVVHRDIKPSNLIVDQSGKPWVVDFGLARMFDAGDDVTRIAGTPRYMAPEQFTGTAIPSSDIFGLGLTLYELVTQTRVYDTDTNHESAELPQQKKQPLPSLGELVPGVPADLEQILMKCVAVQPGDRYSDADALMEDLERFLDNRPLLAAKTSTWIRCKRWSQRNPETAIATGLVGSLLVAIAVISSFSYWNEYVQRTRLETALNVSMNTLDKVYDRLAPDADAISNLATDQSGKRRAPFLSRENARLLNDLLSSFDELARLDSSNLEIKLAAAKANFRVGEIHRRLGNSEQARLALNKSIELHRQLATEEAGLRDATSLRIIQATISLGRERDPVSRKNDQNHLTEALAMIEELAKSSTLDETIRLDLRFEKARTLYLLGVMPKRPPAEFTAGNSEVVTNRETVNNEYLERAVGILEQWSPPLPARISNLLSLCYGERSEAFDDEDARRSIEFQELLLEQYPDSLQFKANLAGLYSLVDPLHLELNELAKAIQQTRKAIRISLRLDLNDVRIRNIVKHAHHKLAMMFGRVAKNPDEFGVEQIESMVGNGIRKPMDEAVRHARKAIELHHFGTGDPAIQLQGLSPDGLAWSLRFRTTLCDLLWSRNQGTDRSEVEMIVEQSILAAGAANRSEPEGRSLGNILDQLIAIRNRIN